MATSTVEALGLLEPAVWTPLYPGSLYDPARFRSMTPEGFAYDPVFLFASTEEGFLICDEHGFRVETEEDVVGADDIASFCARVKALQDEVAARLGSKAVIGVEEVACDDDDDYDMLEEAGFAACFGLIIESVEELLEDDGEHP
uniref:Uncharacterized protein n=1 Tax=Oryza meridionalis TaxID=40149 RepID=A0A0E0DG09_9ORYZ